MYLTPNPFRNDSITEWSPDSWVVGDGDGDGSTMDPSTTTPVSNAIVSTVRVGVSLRTRSVTGPGRDGVRQVLRTLVVVPVNLLFSCSIISCVTKKRSLPTPSTVTESRDGKTSQFNLIVNGKSLTGDGQADNGW